MDIEAVKRKKEMIIERYGPWTSHNIRLYEDVYTIADRIVGDEIKLMRIVQTISDISCKHPGDLRVLDLACLEGLYAVEFACRGARVVGIEGREANIEKARFAKEVLSLGNLELVQDDVRNLNRERYGNFDVVLCLGVFYHLDSPDLFQFMEHLSDVCGGIAVIDTHVSLTVEENFVYGGRTYAGSRYVEHSPESTPQERLGSPWASLDNVTSCWLTKPSLLNLLADVGFTSVFECLNPPEVFTPEEGVTIVKPGDRVTLVALKGKAETLCLSPHMDASHQNFWPENDGSL